MQALGPTGPGKEYLVQGNSVLWVPDVKVLRCFVVGSRAPTYRAVARLNHCAHLTDNADKVETFPDLLMQMRAKLVALGHPEGAKLMGVGAGYSYLYQIFKSQVRQTPDAWLAGAGGGADNVDGPAFQKIPWLQFNGACDKGADGEADSWLGTGVSTNHLRVAAVIWTQSHDWGLATSMVHPYYHQIINNRVTKTPTVASDGSIGVTMPKAEDGWLVDLGTASSAWATIGPHATFAGDRKKSGWVPDRYTASVWRAFVSRVSPVSIKSPAPGSSSTSYLFKKEGDPFDVEVAVTGKPGVYPSLRDPSTGGFRTRSEIGLEGRTTCRNTVPLTQEAPAKVALYSGDMKIAEVSAPPYKFTGIKLRAGIHALIAVAEYADGSKANSFPSVVYITNWDLSPCLVAAKSYKEMKACPAW